MPICAGRSICRAFAETSSWGWTAEAFLSPSGRGAPIALRRDEQLLRVVDLERHKPELLVGAGDQKHHRPPALGLELGDLVDHLARIRHVGLAHLDDHLAGLDALRLSLASRLD